MRLHLKNLSPECHGLISQHKAEHNHKNLDETVECLIKKAMIEYKPIHDFQMMVEKDMLNGRRDENGRFIYETSCSHWDNINGCEMKQYLPGDTFSENEIMECDLIHGVCEEYQK